MINITAAGGVLFQKEEQKLLVLLIYRRGVWDLPKGKREEEETVEECASREIAEELGCRLPTILGKLTQTYHEYSEGNKKMGKTTHWYAMQTNTVSNFIPQKEEGIEKIIWTDISEARNRVGYKNLVDVLEAFQQWYSVK